MIDLITISSEDDGTKGDDVTVISAPADSAIEIVVPDGAPDHRFWRQRARYRRHRPGRLAGPDAAGPRRPGRTADRPTTTLLIPVDGSTASTTTTPASTSTTSTTGGSTTAVASGQVGVPHLPSPGNPPPGTSDEPVAGTDNQNVSYLKDLWHAVQNQQISRSDLLLALAQRSFTAPVPADAPAATSVTADASAPLLIPAAAAAPADAAAPAAAAAD